MLNEDIEFNRKLITDWMLYRYRLLDQEGEGIDLTWCVVIDNEQIERKGDNYPVYEVPEGKMVLLDEFVWCPAWASPETVVGGSVGRVTLDGRYHITINAGCRSMEVLHVPLKRPIPYFAGEWIGACPHLIGKAERSAFRMTMRFREIPMPKNAKAGKLEGMPSAR
jgi:hypothetical protein